MTYLGMFLGEPVSLIEDGTGLQDSLYSILLVGDGYRAEEAYLFWMHCWQIQNLINNTWTFANRKVSVFARAYASADSGTTIPRGCINPLPNSASTYFGSEFTSTCRLLIGDNAKANTQSLNSYQNALPGSDPGSAFTATVVLVNTPHRGASYNVETNTEVIWVSAGHPEFLNLLQHELGHSMLLGDEYDYYTDCTDGYCNGTGVPGVPNVSNAPSPTPWDWVPGFNVRIVETRRPRDCARCDLSDETLLEAGIGAFEGAGNYHCGFFRPTRICKMRHIAADFCPVCIEQITATIT